ncbi:hypothetical protein PR048_024404 [Dryococelus australis]|uniref:Ig-like domain-containing protein n=1 Tax=Dryococelus australis TaxID=614101 RepID=A0ABQ9GNJ5_9NEOP|nr:hypothetical protein PR048_024404 [Dryococelus australis]
MDRLKWYENIVKTNSTTEDEEEGDAVQEDSSTTEDEEEGDAAQEDSSTTEDEEEGDAVQEDSSTTEDEEEGDAVQEDSSTTEDEEEGDAVQEDSSTTEDEEEGDAVQEDSSTTEDEEEGDAVQEDACNSLDDEERESRSLWIERAGGGGKGKGGVCRGGGGAGRPPTARGPVNVTGAAGAETSLRCPVAGFPLSGVSWSRGRQSLPHGPRQSLLPDRSLRLSRLDAASDQGEYHCVAHGPHGRSAASSVRLHVMGEPHAPTREHHELYLYLY